jgi:ABC-type transporter Mla MlaB component
MAFPFFGKKKTSTGDKSRPPEAGGRMPAPRIVQPPPLPKPPEEPDGGLEHPPPKEELPALDFSTSDLDLELSPEDAEPIELKEGSSRVHPVVEEAAILYANGGTEQAVQVLEAEIERDTLGSDAEQVWSLLFELYQMLERREAFDQRALDYVVRFEKSPPAWIDSAAEAAAAASTVPICKLSGALSAASAKQFEQMHRILAKNKVVRLDVAKVNSADADGCTQVNELIAAARRLRHAVALQNTDALLKLLADRISIGRRDHQPIWLLLLEILQQADDHEGFEEWALNYAITFEVSPPSWERPAAAVRESDPGGAGSGAAAAAEDVFALSGEMLGPCTNTYLSLNEFGLRHDAVEVDMAQLRRMDFVSAGMLLNTVSELAGRGKAVRLTHVGGLVAALLNVVGVGHVAQIERRRT